MISIDEVQALIAKITQAVKSSNYQTAIEELSLVHQKYLLGQTDQVQNAHLEEFVALVRGQYNRVTRAAAILGIAIGERLMGDAPVDPEQQLKHHQLGLLLALGRAIFNTTDHEEVGRLLNAEFQPSAAKEGILPRPRFCPA